jgi:hypothetical protein
MALLQAAAPHHLQYGVPIGPPQYAVETFPSDSFSSENPQVFSSKPETSTLSNFVSESSTTFGQASSRPYSKTSVFNAFLQQRPEGHRTGERPSTSSTGTRSHSSTASPPSPVSTNFPTTPVSRNDSGLALQSSLREKRSGQLSDPSRRNSGIGHFAKLRDPYSNTETARLANNRRPSVGAFSANAFGHHPSYSTSTLPNMSANYAPSVYAQSTLAASTIMQPTTIVPVRDTEATHWVEGHCLQRQKNDLRGHCALCDERCDEDVFKCSGK